MTRDCSSGRTLAGAMVLTLCLTVQAISQSTVPATGGAFKVGRTPDGHPDLQGIYVSANRGSIYSHDIESPAQKINRPFPTQFQDWAGNWKPIIVDPPDHRIPYLPWARAERQRLYETARDPHTFGDIDPGAFCTPSGQPRNMYTGSLQVFQNSGHVVFANSQFHQYWVVPLDNRPHVSDKIKLFMGDSRGRWEGDTLVVETTNFNGRNWFDLNGDFRTDSFKMVERWTKTGPDSLQYETTIEDPKIYSRPWTMRIPMEARRNADMLEEACHEGNRSFMRLVPKNRGDGRIGK